MDITVASRAAHAHLAELDKHVTSAIIGRKIDQREIIIAHEATTVIGWLRYGYFWDTIPFMNLLNVQERYRGQGIGTQLVAYWERSLRDQGFTEVLTSTLANERAQFLYRKLGYHDCGALLLPNEPLELFMRKSLE